MDQIKVELQEWMGSDRSIAESAWTSSLDLAKKKLRSDMDVERIVNILADLKHSTPFESVIFRFWIRMPIFIDRQHMTHRIASHNGSSSRYRTMSRDYFDLPDDVHMLLEDKVGDFLLIEKYLESCEIANNNYSISMAVIKQAEKENKITNMEFKRIREILRAQLPLANMVERTSIFNLRSFANYQKLRNSNQAQIEIRRVAQLMLQEVKKAKIAPVSINALERNNWVI